MNTVKANANVKATVNSKADDLEFDFAMCHGSYICCRQYIYR